VLVAAFVKEPALAAACELPLACPRCRSLRCCLLSACLPACPPRLPRLQFEMRYDEVELARAVFERYVEILPSVKAWVRCVCGGGGRIDVCSRKGGSK
jgi:hypothetical protein